jgi:protein deglycase
MHQQFSEYELSVALSFLIEGNKPFVTVGLNNQPIKGES